MNFSKLNGRHKAGLFLVAVAAGLALLLEASARQTAGIVLLGLAATWFLGSLSVRVLWLSSSVLACIVGILVVGKPVADDWKSFQESALSYDRAIADLRKAVVLAEIDYDALAQKHGGVPAPAPSSTNIDYDAIARKYGGSVISAPTAWDINGNPIAPLKLPPGATLVSPGAPQSATKPASTQATQQEFSNIRPLPGVAEYDRVAKKWFGYDWFAENAPGKIQKGSQARELSKNQSDWFAENAPEKFRVVEVPATTQDWERYFGSEGQPIDQKELPPVTLPADFFSTRVTKLSFRADVDKEELISTIQNQLLEPRPKFSLRASLISNRLFTLMGLVFLVAGLFSLGWFTRNVLRAK